MREITIVLLIAAIAWMVVIAPKAMEAYFINVEIQKAERHDAAEAEKARQTNEDIAGGKYSAPKTE